MNNKILFLVSKIGPGNKLIISYLKKKLQQDEILIARFSDLYFEVNGKSVVVDVGDTGNKLSDFDFAKKKKTTLPRIKQIT